jgi:hypothetical protein
MEMASLAFLIPWFKVLTSDRINSRTASPAASSAAELIRSPDDNRWVDVLSAP